MFEDNPQPTTQPENPGSQSEQTDQPQAQTPESAPQAQPETPKAPEAPKKSGPPTSVPVKTTQDERIWAAIGYVAFLGVVSMAMKPKSEFCKQHASQGLVIFVIWFIGLILLAFPSFIGAIGGFILLAASVIAIIGIIKAIQSYQFKMPILSDIAAKIPMGAIVGSVTGKTPETESKKEEKQAEQAPAKTPSQQETPQAPTAPQEPVEPQAPTQPESPQQPQAPEDTEEKPQQ